MLFVQLVSFEPILALLLTCLLKFYSKHCYCQEIHLSELYLKKNFLCLSTDKV